MTPEKDHNPRAQRRAAVRAESDTEAADQDVPQKDIHPMGRLVNDGMERAVSNFQPGPGADQVRIGDPVHRRDQGLGHPATLGDDVE